jgi:HlyD family secretion protein
VNRRIILAVLLVILAAAIIGYLLYGRNQRPEGALRISGNVELTEVQVSFKVPGRVATRPVDEGMLVKRGETVATLEDAELKDELRLAQSEADAAAATLAELRAGSRPEEIAQGEALLARAEADAHRLSTDYRREVALYGREVIAKKELEAAKAANDQAQATVRERREAVRLLRKGPRIEQIDQARARLKGAQARVATAQERLGYTRLVAPISGVVLSKSVEPGEQVSAGTPVITMGDLEQCWLKGYIPETELGRVRLGQRARVTTDSYPGKAFEGRVSFISSQAEFTPKSVQTEKERVKLVYRIKITLNNPQMVLKPGMPADAVIDIAATAPGGEPAREQAGEPGREPVTQGPRLVRP